MRAAFALILLLWSSIALAEKRVALVIGNGAYTRVPKLDNPKNDAAAVEGMLKAAAFDTVVLANDLGIVAMRRALRDFSDAAHDADIAVVFFAGHGMEVSGTNYLIPIDAVLERDIDARDEAVSLDRVNEMMESVKRLRLVILDACRDNPFVRSMRRTLATRAVRSGYGEIDEKSLPPNTLVAYAQRAGATAEDGAGSHSPYTTALLRHLPTPGLDIELALRRVRDDVLQSTRNKQEPFKYGSLGGTEIALVPTTVPRVPATPQRSAIDYDKEMEIAFWNAVKDARSKDLLQAYLDRYPTGNFAGLAKVLIEQLGKEQRATQVAAERDIQAQQAEAARIAAEAKQAEELRKADALRRKEEEKRIEELKGAQAQARAEAQGALEAVRQAEADRLAALKAAEAARREAEDARAEQARLANLAADAEAARKAMVVAGLPPGGQAPAVSKSADDLTADQAKLARALQTELKRVGCNPGEIDGQWGAKAKGALIEFTRVAKVTLPSDAPTSEALQAVLGKKGRICPPTCGANEKEQDGRCIAKAKPERIPRRMASDAKQATKTGTKEGTKKSGLCYSGSGATNASPHPCNGLPGEQRAN